MEGMETFIKQVVDRLARIETKLDAMQHVENIADGAEKMAQRALNKAENNEDRINEMRAKNIWLERFIYGIAIAIIGYFLMKYF